MCISHVTSHIHPRLAKEKHPHKKKLLLLTTKAATHQFATHVSNFQNDQIISRVSTDVQPRKNSAAKKVQLSKYWVLYNIFLIQVNTLMKLLIVTSYIFISSQYMQSIPSFGSWFLPHLVSWLDDLGKLDPWAGHTSDKYTPYNQSIISDPWYSLIFHFLVIKIQIWLLKASLSQPIHRLVFHGWNAACHPAKNQWRLGSCEPRSIYQDQTWVDWWMMLCFCKKNPGF